MQYKMAFSDLPDELLALEQDCAVRLMDLIVWTMIKDIPDDDIAQEIVAQKIDGLIKDASEILGKDPIMDDVDIKSKVAHFMVIGVEYVTHKATLVYLKEYLKENL